MTTRQLEVTPQQICELAGLRDPFQPDLPLPQLLSWFRRQARESWLRTLDAHNNSNAPVPADSEELHGARQRLHSISEKCTRIEAALPTQLTNASLDIG
jgi:hypothetical protein